MLCITFIVLIVKLVSSVPTKEELEENYRQLSSKEYVEYFNKQNFTWKIAHYDREFPLCGVQLERSHKSFDSYVGLDVKDIPASFDSREQWPQCENIGRIRNQGTCGSCWTFGTADTASDRTCIGKNIHVNLSEQDLECSTESYICNGGDPGEAFTFWKDHGLATSACKPYDIDEGYKVQCRQQCANNSIDYNNDKHFANNVYRIPSDDLSIKKEIATNGPIQAAFTVFEDFVNYTSGIYVHQHGEARGGHSVRVIGYGEENGQTCWIAANSWGTVWGEKGLFRIQAGQEGVNFEDDMYSGIAKC